MRNKKTYISIVILYHCIVLFYQFFSQMLLLILNVMFVAFVLYNLKKNKIHYIAILPLLIATSFFSVVGTSFSLIPLPWLYVFIMILLIYTCRRRINRTYICLFLIFTIFLFSLLFKAILLEDALKQMLTILMFSSCFIIGDSVADVLTKRDWSFMCFNYLLGVIAFTLQIILQYVCFSWGKLYIARAEMMGAYRVAFAGLMSDYSFASLYIATGIVLLIVINANKNKMLIYIGNKRFVCILLMMLGALLITSARTGLVALAAGVLFYLLYLAVKARSRLRLFALLGLGTFALVFREAVNLMGSQRNQGFLDSSNRIVNYINALELFSNHMFLGYGLGLENLRLKTFIMVPHNIIIQYLLQFGIIGCLLFLLFFLILFIQYRCTKASLLPVFLVCITGAMFIPDIVSSRFFSVIVIMLIIELKMFGLKRRVSKR